MSHLISRPSTSCDVAVEKSRDWKWAPTELLFHLKIYFHYLKKKKVHACSLYNLELSIKEKNNNYMLHFIKRELTELETLEMEQMNDSACKL